MSFSSQLFVAKTAQMFFEHFSLDDDNVALLLHVRRIVNKYLRRQRKWLLRSKLFSENSKRTTFLQTNHFHIYTTLIGFLIKNLPGPESCLIKENDLVDGLRVLVKLEGHFHPGKIQAISPPDIYGVLVDKERGNKPHIFSREEVLQEAVRALPSTFSTFVFVSK